MRKKLFLIVIAIAILFVYNKHSVSFEQRPKDDSYRQLDLFANVFSYIKSDYVEETKNKDLVYGAISGMVASLDPHSQFLTPEEYAELKSDTEGKFGGLGIEITLKDGLITIVTPIEDTPAWNAGLKSGDRIVKINDEVTRDFSLADGVRKMRGEPGTKINLTILRESEKKLIEVSITRDIIKVKDIKKAQLLQDEIAHIRLLEFRENTADELRKVVNNLKKEGMKALIFDLRNNPGGLLTAAVETSQEFLPKESLVVFTQGRDGKNKIEFLAKEPNPETEIPLVVLINEGSASGSEIFAGALQDHKRAIILGTKSFGKGSVQTLIPLKDGSAIKLTTSIYYTPLGRLIHKAGITPDIIVEFKEPPQENEKDKNQKNDIVAEEAFKKVENKSPEQPKEEEYKKDNQIMTAIDVLKGILIYNLNHQNEK